MSQEIGKESGDHAIEEIVNPEDQFVSIHTNKQEPECENNSEIFSSDKTLSSTHSLPVRRKKSYLRILFNKMQRSPVLIGRKSSFKTRTTEARRIKMSYIAKKLNYESLRSETSGLQDLLMETLNSLRRIRTHVLNVVGKDLGDVEKLVHSENVDLDLDSCEKPSTAYINEERIIIENQISCTESKNSVKLLNSRNIALGLPKRFLIRFQRRSNELLQRITEINKESAIISRRFIQWAEDESNERKKGELVVERAKNKFINLHESRTDNHKKSVEILSILNKLLQSTEFDATHFENETTETKLPGNIKIYIESWRKLDQLKSIYTMQKTYLKSISETHRRISDLIKELNDITLKRLYSYHLHIQTRYKYQRLTAQGIIIWNHIFAELDQIQASQKETEKGEIIFELEKLVYDQLDNKGRIEVLKKYFHHLEEKYNRLHISLENCQDARKQLVIFIKDKEVNNIDKSGETSLWKTIKKWLLENNISLQKIISSKSIIGFHQHIWNFKNLFHFLIGGAEIFSLQNHIKPMIIAVNEKRNKIIQLDRFLYELTLKNVQESFSTDEKQKHNTLEEQLLNEKQRVQFLENHWKLIQFEAIYAHCTFYQTLKLNTHNETLLTSDSSDEEKDLFSLDKTFDWPKRIHEDLETLSSCI